MARANSIHLVCFPPHCTHIIQPLDVSVFGPVKAAWKSVLKMHQLETCAATVTKEDFPMLLARLFEKSFLPQHFISGFTKCGLCPLSRDKIPSHKLQKSNPYVKSVLPESEKDELSGKLTPRERPAQNEENSHTRIHIQTDSSDGHSQSENLNTSSDELSRSEKSDNTEKPSKSNIVLELSGNCSINGTVTPIRLHRDRQVDKRKVRPKFYGEALTLDEVHDRIVAEKEEKEAAAKQNRKAAKQKKAAVKVKKTVAKQKKAAAIQSRTQSSKAKLQMFKSKATLAPPLNQNSTSSDLSEEETISSEEDDGVCEECAACYKDDEKMKRKCWMGCDTCDRWFHYQCVGFSSIPDSYWSCKYCVLSQFKISCICKYCV